MSEITAPLRQLLKKDINWSWNQEHTSAMNKTKKILSSSPVLSFFNTSKDVQIQVDASSRGLGACIIQEGHPIS